MFARGRVRFTTNHTRVMKKITEEIAKKVLAVVDCGLTNGLDDESHDPDNGERPKPGHMCVEAAVCYAMGEPHNDRPACVDNKLASFKINLNDQDGWDSNKSRARGLRGLAIAQLGTRKKFDVSEFHGRLRVKLFRDRLCASLLEGHELNKYVVAEIEAAKTADQIDNILQKWQAYSSSVEHADQDVWPACKYSSTSTEFYLGGLSGANDWSEVALRKIADAAVEVLAEMKTPGSKFLYLARKKKAAKAKKTAKAKLDLSRR